MEKTLDLSAVASVDLSKKIAEHLPARSCEAWARRTGFQRREPRKISPVLLLRSLGALAFCSRCSLETLACVIGWLGGKPVSKQAVAKRLDGSCVAFLRQALFAVLGSVAKFDREREGGVFERFRRVLIQDSTTLPLPARLAAAFPGSRNQSGKTQALAKIQAVYDLRAERFLTFALTPFTRNDQAASRDILAVARRGDLVLRDLGYFVLSVFARLHRRGIFFLTRLRQDVILLDEAGRQFDLLRHLRRHRTLDVDLLVGKKERLPLRLVAVPLPRSIADARRRKAKQNRDKRCRPSKKHLELLGWEIFVTNVPSQVWSTEVACQVYGLRWRIETIFKAWKSHFRITDVTTGSAYQIQIVLYARLLAISLFQTFFGLLAEHIHRAHRRSLSLLRLSRFLAEHHWIVAQLTRTSDGLQLLEQLIAKHCCYTKRRHRSNYAEILRCLS